MTPPSGPQSSSPIWKALRWIFALGLIAAIAVVLAKNFAELKSYEFELRVVPLVMAVVFYALYLLGRGAIWHLLMRWNHAGTTLRFDVTAWLASVTMGKYIPGKVALYAGRIYWYRNERISGLVVSACFVLDAVATLVSAALIILVACLIVPFEELERFRIPAIAMSAVCIPFIHPRPLQTLINIGARLLGRESVKLPVSFAQCLIFTLLLAADWMFMGFGACFLVSAVAPLDAASVPFVAAAFVISSVSGMIAIFAPGGLGVREGVFAVLLGAIFPAGLSALLALISRLWLTAVEAAVLGILYVFHIRTNGLRDGAKEKPGDTPSTK